MHLIHAGFDPLRLGATDKEQLAWYREGELYNGRWAMAAVAGILFTDALGLPKFWEAGAEVRMGKGVAWMMGLLVDRGFSGSR